MEFSHLQAVDFDDAPVLDFDALAADLLDKTGSGWRLAAFFGLPEKKAASKISLFCLLALDAQGRLSAMRSKPLASFPSLTPACPQAHWFEREIFEQWRVEPLGHPWLKPIRFSGSQVPSEQARPLPGVTDYFKVKGAHAHEVAVGPVHAGVIEPGHFRFQCYGENVMHLEISLGYQHRGVEKAILDGNARKALLLAETAAGDSSIAHASAYCSIIETLNNAETAARGQVLRQIALELERLANHTGDMGALAGDVGYLPSMSYCGRIRGDFLNATALICGNRFGRGLVQPGGCALDLDQALAAELLEKIEAAAKDMNGSFKLMMESATVRNRFSGTGIVSGAAARDLGLVGVAARAGGVETDARHDFPLQGAIRKEKISVRADGDVMARAEVRRIDAEESVDFIRRRLPCLPEGPALRAGFHNRPPKNKLAVSFVEGWRGSVTHVGITGEDGAFRAYKIIDPSFHNWIGLAMALRGEQISDFPLCNKSFNLSYCGHDL